MDQITVVIKAAHDERKAVRAMLASYLRLKVIEERRWFSYIFTVTGPTAVVASAQQELAIMRYQDWLDREW